MQIIQGYGLVDPNKPRSRRLILAIDAMEKDGKTRFSLTAPGPIGYMDFDNRSEGTIEQFLAAGKKILWRIDDKGHPKPYQIPADLGASDEKSSETQALARTEWKRFEDDFEKLLANPDIRTIVVDTASEAWELIRLAGLGKLKEIPPHLYDEVNSAYRRIIRLARKQTRVNLILVHRLKDEWANDKKDGKLKSYTTGRKERAGFGQTGFLADANLLLYRLPVAECEKGDLGFRLLVKDCGANAELRGLELANDMIEFPFLAAMITRTSPDDWK